MNEAAPSGYMITGREIDIVVRALRLLQAEQWYCSTTLPGDIQRLLKNIEGSRAVS